MFLFCSSGDLCDIEINECISQPCYHQGTCEDEPGGYQCVCLPGYMGVHCETGNQQQTTLNLFSRLSKIGQNLISKQDG